MTRKLSARQQSLRHEPGAATAHCEPRPAILSFVQLLL